jgi:allantoin racemase
VVAQARTALDRDGSDVIVLGCAGMAGYCAEISVALGVPVVDGVSAATLLVQSLVTLGLRTPKRGEYAPPPVKPYKGILSSLQPHWNGSRQGGVRAKEGLV